MITLKNRAEIVKEVTEMLKTFSAECSSYHTDIYIYYDAETQTATLDTYESVDGNSWLDDDHRTIYTDKPHEERIVDYWYSVDDFAYTLGITAEELSREVAEYVGEDDDYVAGYADTRDYIEKTPKYWEKITKAYADVIEGIEDEDHVYSRKAEEIVSAFEESED